MAKCNLDENKFIDLDLKAATKANIRKATEMDKAKTTKHYQKKNVCKKAKEEKGAEQSQEQTTTAAEVDDSATVSSTGFAKLLSTLPPAPIRISNQVKTKLRAGAQHLEISMYQNKKRKTNATLVQNCVDAAIQRGQIFRWFFKKQKSDAQAPVSNMETRPMEDIEQRKRGKSNNG